jgi:hypothetical protein
MGLRVETIMGLAGEKELTVADGGSEGFGCRTHGAVRVKKYRAKSFRFTGLTGQQCVKVAPDKAPT